MTSHPESEKLRECPLCGSHVRSGYYEHDYGGYGWVACMGDKCGIQVEDETETRAIRRWNTRPPSQYREALEELIAEWDTAGKEGLMKNISGPLELRISRARAALASPQGDGWVMVDEAHPLPDDLKVGDEILLRRRLSYGPYGGEPYAYRRSTK